MSSTLITLFPLRHLSNLPFTPHLLPALPVLGYPANYNDLHHLKGRGGRHGADLHDVCAIPNSLKIGYRVRNHVTQLIQPMPLLIATQISSPSTPLLPPPNTHK